MSISVYFVHFRGVPGVLQTDPACAWATRRDRGTGMVSHGCTPCTGRWLDWRVFSSAGGGPFGAQWTVRGVQMCLFLSTSVYFVHFRGFRRCCRWTRLALGRLAGIKGQGRLVTGALQAPDAGWTGSFSVPLYWMVEGCHQAWLGSADKRFFGRAHGCAPQPTWFWIPAAAFAEVETPTN